MAPLATAYSMTGSGLASGPTELGTTHVEVRSVNGRTLVVKPRLCAACQGLESAIETRVARALGRGTVFVTIDITEQAATESILDRNLAERVVAELRGLGSALKLPGDVSVGDLLRVPGLFATDGTPRSRTSWEPPESLAALVDQALDQLLETRGEEGRSTVAAMTAELEQLRELLTQAARRAPEVIDGHRQRLLRRVNEFLEGQARVLEAADVIREVALVADRADVSEELQRLEAHLEKLREQLEAGGAMGRTLEFLLQEALREANTLGSKAQDAELAHIVVAMKSGIDKLKEQAANLE